VCEPLPLTLRKETEMKMLVNVR